MRSLMAVLLLLLVATAAFAQPASSDAQLTQALLNEIRQLRQDLQITAAVIQRAQILIYRLQMETSLLTRATQRLDEARNRCSSYQSQVKSMRAQMEQYESRAQSAQNPVEQRNAQDILNRVKSNLAMVTNEEQQCQPRVLDAQSQVQAAQARVSGPAR